MQRTPLVPRSRTATNFPRLALAALLLATSSLAQQPNEPPRLVQTGRAFARSDGVVTHCMFTADASRALTIGRERDLVWWDLRERRPLRHVEPLEMPFVDVLLHPDEPWLVCLAADGTGVQIDLEGDRRTVLTETQIDNLAPATDRTWLRGGSPMARAEFVSPNVTSANGQFHLVFTRNRWGREPSNAQLFREGNLWIANDGTIVNARGRVLEFFGLRRTDRTTASVHCGAPRQMVFTPDGSHLALASSSQTAVVDLTGREIAHWPGPLLPSPGPGPDEFWLLADDGMQLWSCTQRGPVGERVTWPGHSIFVSGKNLLLGHRGPALLPMIVRNGQPWTEEVARLTDGSWRELQSLPFTEFTKLEFTGDPNSREPYDPECAIAFTTESTTSAAILLTSSRGGWKFGDVAKLRLLANDATTTHQRWFGASARWMVAVDSRVIVGFHERTVATFDRKNLDLVNTTTVPGRIIAAVALGPDLLATYGDAIAVLDATTLAKKVDVPLPVGLPGVDRIAISTDGRRVALAWRSEVRILTVE